MHLLELAGHINWPCSVAVNPDGLTQAIENDVDIMEGIEFEVDEIGNIVN